MRLFNRHVNKWVFFLVAMESVLLFLGVILTAWIRFDFSWADTISYNTVPKAVFITIVCQIVLYYCDLYSLKGQRNLGETFLNFIQSMGLAFILLAIFYYLIPHLIIGRGIGILSFLLLLLILTLWRGLFDHFLASPQMKERIIIIGIGEMAANLARDIMNDLGSGFQVVGFISSNEADVGRSIVNPKVIGTVEQLSAIVREHKVAGIVVALDERRLTLPVREILQCKLEGILIHEGTALMEQISGKISVENLRPSWIIFSDGFRVTPLTITFKRIMDVTVSSILIAMTWPIMLLVVMAIKIDSPGPVLYRQTRVGQWGREFTLLKFRSMGQNAESNGPQWATEDDTRVTRVGRVIRKLRLDELPQLVNVLKGYMSLVGPRPERPEFVVQLREKIPFYDQRHSVKPGVTGWAQVRFNYGNSVEDSLQKLEYDLYYIKHIAPVFDLLIIFQTIKVVLLGRGAM